MVNAHEEWDMAAIHHEMGVLSIKVDEFASAEIYHNKSLTIKRRLRVEDSTPPLRISKGGHACQVHVRQPLLTFSGDTMATIHQLAVANIKQRRLDQAEKLLRLALSETARNQVQEKVEKRQHCGSWGGSRMARQTISGPAVPTRSAGIVHRDLWPSLAYQRWGHWISARGMSLSHETVWRLFKTLFPCSFYTEKVYGEDSHIWRLQPLMGRWERWKGSGVTIWKRWGTSWTKNTFARIDWYGNEH